MGLIALIVLGAFGFACVRSACVHRRTGWITGLLLGLAMLVAGWGGLCWWLYSIWVH